MSEKSRLLKNTGLIAIGNFGAKMISFLLLPLYTSILNTSEYGNYDFIVAVSAFLLPVITLSMHEAMFRFIIDAGNEGEDFKKVITNALVSIICGIVFFLCVICLIYVFTDKSMCLYIWVYVAASALYTFSNNLLRGMGRIKEYAIISSGKNILQLILNIVVVAIMRWGMEGLMFSMCISEMLAFIIVSVLSKLGKHIRLKYISRQQIKSMLLYSLPLIPNSLCAQIINLSDRIVISGVMGADANGIYTVSYKFPNIIETVYHYFYTAWSESASRVLAKGKEEAKKYYQSLYDSIDDLMFSVILVMIACMPILYRLFVRGDYVDGFAYIPLLMFAMYFDSLAKFYSGLYTALKRTKVMATSTLVAAVFNLVINFLFIGGIGLYAAAGSTLVANIVLVCIRKKYISNDIGIKINCKKVIVEIVMALVILLLYSYNDWKSICWSIIIAVIYAVIVNRAVFCSIYRSIKKRIKA